jgi:hypothetical protein
MVDPNVLRDAVEQAKGYVPKIESVGCMPAVVNSQPDLERTLKFALDYTKALETILLLEYRDKKKLESGGNGFIKLVREIKNNLVDALGMID